MCIRLPLRTPLIKVASDAKPYSKLQPTNLNGGEGAVCILLMICIIGGAFLLGRPLFSWSVLTILQLVIATISFSLFLLMLITKSSNICNKR